MGNEQLTVTTSPPKIRAVAVYPNPASDYFYVKSDGLAVKKLEIYNTQIKLLKTIKNNIIENSIPINYKPGIYGIKLYLVTGETKWFKLVKL